MMSRRKAMLVPLALAGMMVAGVVSPVAAQDATPAARVNAASTATIDVTGSGESEVKADWAILQLIVRIPFIGDPSSTSNTQGDPNAAPVAVSEEQLTAVIAALEEGGVDGGKIKSVIQPAGPYVGMFGYGTAVVAVELSQKQVAKIEDLTNRAVEAGKNAGLMFDPVNVAYVIENCQDVERAALADAVTDGQAQAQTMADVLGVNLGELLSATKQQSYGAYYAGGPATSVCGQQATVDDALRAYFSAYDPSTDGSVDVYMQITLSYGIA
jgi:uncharacterized protein YggE